MLWGIYVTVRGLLFRTRIILIKEEQIIISEIFRRKVNTYSKRDIKSISLGNIYLMGIYSEGIKLTFKNEDIYKFIWYDYLNFEKMKAAFNELKEIKEKYIIQ